MAAPLAALLTLSLAAAPAAEPPPAEPSPWVAAAASGLAFPVVALGTGAALGSLATTPAAPVLYGVWGLSPLLTGAGHFYAGDTKRAVFVGLGGPLVVMGGGLVGGVAAVPISAALNPADKQAALGGILIGAFASAVGYLVWATVDAYQTAELEREGRRPQDAPR